LKLLPGRENERSGDHRAGRCASGNVAIGDSRELGVSLSTVDRWLGAHDEILLASMLDIRRFLEECE
jgi:hypothetical protein